MKRLIDDVVLTLKNLFLPIFCDMCERRILTEENRQFCPQCWELSPLIERPFCTLCGRPHPKVVAFGSIDNFPCAECREGGDVHYDRIYGTAHYDGAVCEAIKMLKFKDKPHMAVCLGELMRKFVQQEMDRHAYDWVVPVPLHNIRARERGYNQSCLLAEQLLQVFENAKLDESLVRVRPTRKQTGLQDREDRMSNVIGAFGVLDDGDVNKFDGATVLLVDDVVTTGSTVSECAAALKRSGVVRVDVLAAALTTGGAEDFL